MNNLRKLLGIVLFALCWQTCNANSLTGTVAMLLIDPSTNHGYARLTGLPVFDGGGCSNSWVAGSLDDPNFVTFVWPALMNAKNRGGQITIDATGCLDGWPRLNWLQVN